MTGNQLRTARLQLSLSAEQLAELLHVTESTVYKWERRGDQDAGVESTCGMILRRIVPRILKHAAPSIIGAAVKAKMTAAGSFAALVLLFDELDAGR